MESWGLRFTRLSPIGYALFFLGIYAIVFGVLFALTPSSELRKGTGTFFVVFSVGVAGLAYWRRRREEAGDSLVFLPKQSPAVAALVAFLLASILTVLYYYFVNPPNNGLLLGACIGSLVGLETYRARRGVKESFLSLVAIYLPVVAVYLLITYLLAGSR